MQAHQTAGCAGSSDQTAGCVGSSDQTVGCADSSDQTAGCAASSVSFCWHIQYIQNAVTVCLKYVVTKMAGIYSICKMLSQCVSSML